MNIIINHASFINHHKTCNEMRSMPPTRNEDLEPAGLDWVSALKNASVRTLLKRP